ncbi:MAG: hypothetical protein M0P57_12440 [Syntrophales bacterium]|jgi:preprotein translocase subunit SecA|nr:hypothetical protein [Syntrophales bacterium]MDY0043074.1 hypothetical protein [Syntrophales bacterium]
MSSKHDIPKGFDGLLNDLKGFCKRRTFSLAGLKKKASAAYEISLNASRLDDRDLDNRLAELRSSIRIGKSGDALLQATGFICEAAYRAVGIHPFIEQIMGSLLLQENFAIQMQTGEGKTITAAVAATILGWRGIPCHVVTSNDYLAKRDAGTMGPLYGRCGVTVGYVIAGMQPSERKAAYGCDITYSTSKELLADFLRDKMAAGDAALSEKNELIHKIAAFEGPGKKVMRGLHAAIIDEADSVLADEATVPLIISVTGKNRFLREAVMIALSLIEDLSPGTDYLIERGMYDISITSKGGRKIEEALKTLPSIWSSYERTEYLIKQALIARHFYFRNVHYVVHEGKIVIVDEKTGRMMEGRSWSGGLHQAVEAKEGVEMTDVTESHIQMSFQLFFRLYRHLSGMSGTLQNIGRELWSIYNLVKVEIPTHAPKRITFYPEKVCASHEEKWDCVMTEIVKEHAAGRAVLVGTRSIRESENLHERLIASGVESTVLNALHHEREAAIIAMAGKRKKITIATNMAGRGTDILVDRDVIEAGGLHVIATERHESRRVDMQLFGRTARQGVPGTGHMISSMDDEVLIRFSPPRLARYLKQYMHTKWGQKAARIIYMYFQRRAEKTRSKIRRKILDQDMRLNKLLSFTKY